MCDSLADVAQQDVPAVNFRQLLRRPFYIGNGLLNIGNHRLDQSHLGMHRSQVQLGPAPRVGGPTHRCQ